jgi:methylenetetrahydrofolate--tRNA-(uracil-5-)-methyltransferase
MGNEVYVLGGGLAGSEAAWQLAESGIKVKLYEMRGKRTTPAHSTNYLAELVCSNSFRSDDINNAVGLLHEEMRKLNSIIMKCADANKIPAGSALAVDRNAFSKDVQNILESHPMVSIIREEITKLPEGKFTIIATGPLTSDALSQEIQSITGKEYLAFFDAIAPIVHYDSIDFTKAWMQSRYDKGEGKDYINCPMNKERYYAFINELLNGEKIEFKDWEKTTPYFNGCLPIEVMAERGVDTLRFGPMKPVGLTDPNSNERPYAVVQLRQDNKSGTIYNMVGFQTKLKYQDQQRIFKTIPGLENAEFARLGGLHRNTFINSPKLLDNKLRFKNKSKIRVAGQITGVEGYLESAAIGLLAGIFTDAEINEKHLPDLPKDTALGSLLEHITGGTDEQTFQPMNINFGLFPPIEYPIKDEESKKALRGSDKKAFIVRRALKSIEHWYADYNEL